MRMHRRAQTTEADLKLIKINDGGAMERAIRFGRVDFPASEGDGLGVPSFARHFSFFCFIFKVLPLFSYSFQM